MKLPLSRLDRYTQSLQTATLQEQSFALKHLSDEISVVASLYYALAYRCQQNSQEMETMDVDIVRVTMRSLIRKVLPNIAVALPKWADDEVRRILITLRCLFQPFHF
jgi:hypothetical protein